MPKPKGFTIIEVIIVLVIGAVIMLAVFLVVPQLQQAQRNSRRQSDARRVLVAARQYTSQGNVLAVGEVTNIISQNLGVLRDPRTDYSYRYFLSSLVQGSGSSTYSDSVMWLKYDVKCNSSNTWALSADSPGSIAVVSILEPFSEAGFDTANKQRYQGVKFCIND